MNPVFINLCIYLYSLTIYLMRSEMAFSISDIRGAQGKRQVCAGVVVGHGGIITQHKFNDYLTKIMSF